MIKNTISNEKNNKKLNIVGQILIVAATILWGTSFIILKNTLDDLPVTFVLGVRFMLSALVLLAVRFKKIFKMSPVRFVTKMRIDYAKELLVTNRRSVSEIAEMCGFSNTYYFSNVFKKQTGFSPSQYTVNDI